MNSTFISAFSATSAEGLAAVVDGPDTVEGDTVSERVAWWVVTQARLVLVHPVVVIVNWDVSTGFEVVCIPIAVLLSGSWDEGFGSSIISG